MKLLRAAIAAFLLALLAGCGDPLPKDKLDYAGEWHGKDMLLIIAQDGSLRYKRVKGGSSTTVSAPIQRFEGASFWVGIGPLATKFDVTVPPHKEGNAWRMVVDGVELTRVAGGRPDDQQAGFQGGARGAV